MAHFVVREVRDDSLVVLIIVILLVFLLGLLAYTPPERPYQTFIEDHKKTQYISIGGESKVNYS